jgi:membrane protease YdiL (CAAX protease family)
MMSTTNKSIIFLAIAFAVTWAIVFACWAAGMHNDPQSGVIALAASMIGPAVAAVICALAFEKGRRAESLGLRFKPNWWWLAAWAIPIAIAAGSVLATVLLSNHAYVDIGDASRQAVEAQGQDTSAAPAFLFNTGFIVAASVIVGALINMVILTFTEELGWRGYLHGLWRRFGFWRTSLATGAIWGVWHAPAIWLFGLNYPDDRMLGIGLFVVFCMLLSPILTLVRDRSGSVWAAGLFHGTFNAVGGLTIAAIANPTFPWNGIVGIGGFIALAIGVAIVALLQRGESPAPASA